MDESVVLQKLNRMPYDMIYTIKQFLPIHTLKRVRKIRPCEFPEDYKELIQKKGLSYSLYENFRLLCNTDFAAITMIKNVLEKKRYDFKRNLTASWFDYLDDELSLNKRLTNIESEYNNYDLLKHQALEANIKYSIMINAYGIIPNI